MGPICEACFHPRDHDVQIISFPGGYACTQCVLRGVERIAAREALAVGVRLFCTRTTPGVSLGEQSAHSVCPRCAPLLTDLVARVAVRRTAT